ncbi:MAG: TPM domain-containing protein [Acinetobacter sp.]|nr:TPM domain-containing protein [Acinetobacter sp.]
MVTTTETTEIVTKPKLDEVVQPSFKRWLKHLLHMPASKRFFNQQDQHAIAQAVAAAEHGHIGEIQVVIEGHMPAREAYYLDTRGRAKQLFAELGTWDTEWNSGILLYLNLCERKVEIVIDRGIQQATTQLVWDEVCQSIIAKMAQQQYQRALVEAVVQIGTILQDFYKNKSQDLANELGNAPIMLN